MDPLTINLLVYVRWTLLKQYSAINTKKSSIPQVEMVFLHGIMLICPLIFSSQHCLYYAVYRKFLDCPRTNSNVSNWGGSTVNSKFTLLTDTRQEWVYIMSYYKGWPWFTVNHSSLQRGSVTDFCRWVHYPKWNQFINTYRSLET